MFEGSISHRKAYLDLDLNLDTIADDDDMPPISPPSALHNRSSSPAAIRIPIITAPPTITDTALNSQAHHHSDVNESIDRLAHVLREQATISRRNEQILLEGCPLGKRSETPLSGHSTAQDAVSKSDLPSQQPVNTEELQTYGRGAETQANIWLTGTETCSEAREAIQSRKLRRQTDLRLQQNPGLEILLTTMVENNVQCNVQGSTPDPPDLGSRSSISRLPSSAQPGGSSQFKQADDDLMDLVVDANYCEGEDEILLNDTIALREAGGPAGIRKLGALKYRSSAEAGSHCRNLKKNIPRMRRRQKTKASAPSAVPAGMNIHT
ncbi:hypothetical protein DL764_008778 [Monosporascus ibericus]|uniref:Uncharacterized protein n=1 Tax=Monosporascus ibericus TaxID=155417 RepID=A0A4Q4T023_9PEZI|nr:hypothetical protein DL764_008778 [Monosporascus ibericus]